MQTINHRALRKGDTIVEGKRRIRVDTVERWPDVICKDGTHVNGDSCYTSEVRIA